MITSLNRATVALALIALISISCAGEKTPVQSEKHSFNVVTLVEGLQNPWSIAWLPDGRMLVTERAGRLRILANNFR
ncbi:MAG TPA: PQQ-dependent sugar dehydrogenase, partial [Burkholderiales bacterium]|nr:PQQ-dependent sugar dehydrogenase [Burkholderiales bacterium]